MQSKSVLGGQRGVSLVECCIALALIGVLAGTAGPSLMESQRKHVLDGSAGEVATDLSYARSMATSHQEGVRVSFRTVVDGACMLVHTGSTSDCTCETGGIAQCGNGAVLVKANYFPASRGVALTANVASIRFDPVRGNATPTGTIHLTTATGQEVRHIVNIMGRVRSCSPAGSAKGYKAC